MMMEREAQRLQRAADHISALILFSDLPEIDIRIEIDTLRQVCASRLPEKTELFEMVYVSRFRRLWNQFRGPSTLFHPVLPSPLDTD